MFFRMIYDDKLAQAAYLIGCQKTGEAIVVDPERDVDRYVALAKGEGLRITAVAETHIHADFLSGARELAELVGAKVYVSDEGDRDWKYQWLDKRVGGGSYAHQLLRDGDRFRVGNIEFHALHSPGHTPEHLSFLVTDLGGGATEPMGALTGDFVFVGDLGRPDLLETAAGNVGAGDPSARRLFATVKRLEALPDFLQIWPGHGAGSACGKALGAVPQTTLGYERRFNAAIRAAVNEADFVEFILDGQPEPPLYFARMKRDNKIGPPVLGQLPQPKAMTAQEMASLDGRRMAVIDTRSWDAFGAAHIAGALFQPLGKSFPTDVGSMVREEEDIVLIVEAARLEEAIRDLVRIGLDRIVGWYDAALFSEVGAAGARLASLTSVDSGEARRMVDTGEVKVLDVRRKTEFAEGHLPGAINIPHTRLDARLEELPRDQNLLVNCLSGARSARAAALLLKHGFRVINLTGGWQAWESNDGAGCSSSGGCTVDAP